MLINYIVIAALSFAQNTAEATLAGPYTFATDVAYGTQSSFQRLDILFPEPVSERRPAIIHIHGGGWYTGGKGGEKTLAMLRAFADAGYIGVSIAYRLSDEAVFPAAVEDCKLAVRWLRANASTYGIDSNRIGAIGASAGGHLSAMLAVTTAADGLEGTGGCSYFPSTISAAVAVCGPLDLVNPLSLALAHEDDPLVVRFLGGTLAEKQDAAKRASPIYYVTATTPPLFLLHGTADKRVHPGQSTAMAEALARAGVPHRIVLVEGGKHGMDIAREDKMLAEIIAFFDEHVKNRSTP